MRQFSQRIVFLTSAPKVWAESVLEYLGLPQYRYDIFTGEPDIRKPNPLAFQQVCDFYNVLPENCISVGDQIRTDILPAKSLGMKTVLVGSKSDEADFCIDTIEQLPELVRRKKWEIS